MQAAQRVLSLIVLAGGALMNPCAAGAIDRGEVLEQMRRRRPADITILASRPVANGTYTLGIFSISTDTADPALRRYKLWKEYPCLLYTSPSPRDRQKSRMPSSA